MRIIRTAPGNGSARLGHYPDGGCRVGRIGATILPPRSEGKMSSKSSAIGKGLLIGAAAGVALYVIWRRSREQREVYETPAQAPERPAEPAPEAVFTPAVAVEPEPEIAEPEPEIEPKPEAVVEPEPVAEAEPAEESAPEPVAEAEISPEPVEEPEPAAVEGPESEPVLADEPEPAAEAAPEPVAAEPRATVEAPSPPAAPIAEHGRRQPITYAGRPRDLSPAGWPQPMPLGASGGLRRPAPVSARATWPGVAGAGQLRPTPPRRIAPRGGAPLHRTG
jgi:hypothetical protein